MKEGPTQRGKKEEHLSSKGPKVRDHNMRRAAALRENLGKRKSQIRVRRGRGAS